MPRYNMSLRDRADLCLLFLSNKTLSTQQKVSHLNRFLGILEKDLIKISCECEKLTDKIMISSVCLLSAFKEPEVVAHFLKRMTPHTSHGASEYSKLLYYKFSKQYSSLFSQGKKLIENDPNLKRYRIKVLDLLSKAADNSAHLIESRQQALHNLCLKELKKQHTQKYREGVLRVLRACNTGFLQPAHIRKAPLLPPVSSISGAAESIYLQSTCFLNPYRDPKNTPTTPSHQRNFYLPPPREPVHIDYNFEEALSNTEESEDGALSVNARRSSLSPTPEARKRLQSPAPILGSRRSSTFSPTPEPKRRLNSLPPISEYRDLSNTPLTPEIPKNTDSLLPLSETEKDTSSLPPIKPRKNTLLSLPVNRSIRSSSYSYTDIEDRAVPADWEEPDAPFHKISKVDSI